MFLIGLILPELNGVPMKDFSMQKVPFGMRDLLFVPGTLSVVYQFTEIGNEFHF